LAVNYIVPKAFVLLNCDIGCELTIIDELQNITGVSYAQRIHGVYDVIAKLELSSQEELRKTILKIRRIDAIHSSLTLMVTTKD